MDEFRYDVRYGSKMHTFKVRLLSIVMHVLPQLLFSIDIQVDGPDSMLKVSWRFKFDDVSIEFQLNLFSEEFEKFWENFFFSGISQR